MMLTTFAYLLAALFAWWASRHFGGNIIPASDAELIADGICLLLMALAMVVHAVERKQT